MIVYVGADHRGEALKKDLITFLQENNFTVSEESHNASTPDDDYPDVAAKIAQAVVNSSDNRGIVICGSGVGVDIAANKIVGIRCGLALQQEQVAAARADDNIQILALAADYMSLEQAKECVYAFLTTAYEQTENHQRRIDKITSLESL